MGDTASLVLSLEIGADLGRMLLHAARIYETDSAALAQSIENSQDAGARHIYVELCPDVVTVTDDGSGMTGRMKEEDLTKIKTWLSGKRDVSWEELVQQLALSSRQSLELMMCSFARSTKIGDPTKLGEKHLGALAHLQFADQTVILSRPNVDLQKDAGLRLADEEVFLLRFPTAAQLEENQLNFGLAGPIIKAIKDPWGKRLFHGTQVVMKGLHPGFERSLAPRLLAEYLGNAFGEDIRNGLVIEVIDRITDEGIKTRGGRVIRVAASTFKGICLMDRELITVHGKHPFRVQLFYAPGSTGHSPRIIRKTSGGKLLRDLGEDFLGLPPWNQLDGTVSAPEGMEWSSSKNSPLQSSRVYRHWIACLRSLNEELGDLIAAADKRSRERVATRFSAEAVDAIVAAMAESPIFGDQPIGTLPDATRKKKTSKARERVEGQVSKRRIEATVMDQYDQAFEGASIELWRGGQLIGQRTTGKSGYVAFSDLALNRRYKIKLVSVPADCLVEGTTEEEIPLTSSMPGFRFPFHVRVNRPPKEKPEEAKKLDRVFRPQLWIRDIPDVDPEKVMYRGRLPGLIEINAANTFVGAALEKSDRAELDHLVSFCCAAAIAEYLLKGQALDFVLQAIGQLAAGIYENLEESRKKKGKKKKI